MLRTRLTLERVLRLNEILAGNLNSQLETLSADQVQRQALKVLCQRNEEAVVKQVREALYAARKEGPGKGDKAAQSPVGEGQ